MNEMRQQIGTWGKRLLTVVYHNNEIFKWYVVQLIVPHPTSFAKYRADEYQIYFNEFERVDKVYFFKKATYMICKELV